jgi:hypothetical protein
MRKVQKGTPIQETVKGSSEYFIYEVARAFRVQFGYSAYSYTICDTFADHIILRDYEMPQDEFWLVTYSQDGDAYTFAAQAEWERVQLAYTPAKNPAPPEVAASMGLSDRAQRTFVESTGPITLVESTSSDGIRRVRGIGMTAGTINENMRRYPLPVMAEAVKKAQAQIDNPAGRIGRGPLMGEAEHPSDRGQSRAQWLNTVFVWESIDLNGAQVILDGRIVPTSQGQDAITLLEHRVLPGLSLRALGHSILLQESGQYIEEVQELELIGWDATIDPADQTADLILQESSAMRLKDLRGVRGLRDKDTETTPATGASPADPPVTPPAPPTPPAAAPPAAIVPVPLADSLSADDRRRLDELAVRERRQQISTAIDAALADSPYAPAIRQQIADAVRGLDLPTVEAAVGTDEHPGALARQRAVADAMLSQAQLTLMGRPSPRGPVISGGDTAQLVPAYALPQQAITDSLVRATFQESHLARVANPRTVNERYAQEYLRRFDAKYKPQLMAEARMFQDAETASDLTLPYTVQRTILTELLPTLVATSIFDVQSVDPAPIVNIGYETFSYESGVALTVTDESITSDDDVWVALLHQHLTFGTVVVTSDPAGTTYTEGTDYVVDYLGGRVMTLAGGTINDATALLVDYGYSAIRQGEMQPIERAQMTLAFFPLNMAYDRLGTQISREAIVFSRGVLNYDVVGRVLQRIIFDLRKHIDGGLMRLALAESLRIANNSGGTWTAATDTYDDLIALIGASKVKVGNRYFEPTGVLMSLTNADRIGNWQGNTNAGGRVDTSMSAAGFQTVVKGLPVFASTEFPDGYIEVINREIVYYRVAEPMNIAGPFPSYHTDGKMIDADQYFAREMNGATGDPGHQGKGSHVIIA